MFEFTDMRWTTSVNLPQEIFALSGLGKEYNETESLLSSTLENGDILLAVKSQIGKEPHPMINIAGCTIWCEGSDSGYYVTGFDVKKKEFFQIIS